MKIAQLRMTTADFTSENLSPLIAIDPHLITVFGSVSFFSDLKLGKLLKPFFPKGHIIGCSTTGAISEQGVSENTLIISAVHFKKPYLKSTSVPLRGTYDSENAGQKIGLNLKAPDLSGIFILGQGVNINGSSMILGLKSKISTGVIITGGLAGDGGAFEKTYVLRDELVSSESVVAFGVYGKNLKLGYGSVGDANPVGPIRIVTESRGNIIFSIDNQPALKVYQEYLGESAKDLPANASQFPISLVKNIEDNLGVTRSLVGIDLEKSALILAGDIPQDSMIRFMHSKSDQLVNSAQIAAKNAAHSPSNEPEFSILVSSVSRKSALGEHASDEIEAVKSILNHSFVAGFYSNGEICPRELIDDCQLQNQTMTITRISEAA